MIIPIEHFLIVSASLFVIGVFGIFLNRKNIIIILMSIELILASVNINFVVFSSYLGDLEPTFMMPPPPCRTISGKYK